MKRKYYVLQRITDLKSQERETINCRRKTEQKLDKGLVSSLLTRSITSTFQILQTFLGILEAYIKMHTYSKIFVNTFCKMAFSFNNVSQQSIHVGPFGLKGCMIFRVQQVIKYLLISIHLDSCILFCYQKQYFSDTCTYSFGYMCDYFVGQAQQSRIVGQRLKELIRNLDFGRFWYIKLPSKNAGSFNYQQLKMLPYLYAC